MSLQKRRRVKKRQQKKVFISTYVYIAILLCGCLHENQGGRHMKQSVEILFNKAIEFTERKDSRLQFRIIDGDNVVVIIQREIPSRPHTFDTGFSEELVLEIPRDVPKNISVPADKWIEKAIYQYGSSVLIFQSCKYNGTLTIHESADRQKWSGECNLWFREPIFDRVGTKEVNVSIKF